MIDVKDLLIEKEATYGKLDYHFIKRDWERNGGRKTFLNFLAETIKEEYDTTLYTAKKIAEYMYYVLY